MGRGAVHSTFRRKCRRFVFDFKRIDSTLKDAEQKIYVESFALSRLANRFSLTKPGKNVNRKYIHYLLFLSKKLFSFLLSFVIDF